MSPLAGENEAIWTCSSRSSGGCTHIETMQKKCPSWLCGDLLWCSGGGIWQAEGKPGAPNVPYPRSWDTPAPLCSLEAKLREPCLIGHFCAAGRDHLLTWPVLLPLILQVLREFVCTLGTPSRSVQGWPNSTFREEPFSLCLLGPVRGVWFYGNSGKSIGLSYMHPDIDTLLVALSSTRNLCLPETGHNHICACWRQAKGGLVTDWFTEFSLSCRCEKKMGSVYQNWWKRLSRMELTFQAIDTGRKTLAQFKQLVLV